MQALVEFKVTCLTLVDLNCYEAQSDTTRLLRQSSLSEPVSYTEKAAPRLTKSGLGLNATYDVGSILPPTVEMPQLES